MDAVWQGIAEVPYIGVVLAVVILAAIGSVIGLLSNHVQRAPRQDGRPWRRPTD